LCLCHAGHCTAAETRSNSRASIPLISACDSMRGGVRILRIQRRVSPHLRVASSARNALGERS
jgi:hypothetical protein